MIGLHAGAVALAVPLTSDRLEAFCRTAEFDRPTLVLDVDRMEAQFHALKAGLGRADIHYAVKANPHPALLQRLARLGANLGLLDADRYDAVTSASVADDEESLRLLLSLGASARLVTSRYDGTALIAAAHLGHDGVVRQLIAAGAPLDHVNNLHWTAAIEAVVLGDGGQRHQRTLRALIDARTNLQLADRQGQTPLALARARGYVEMVRMLELAGAK